MKGRTFNVQRPRFNFQFSLEGAAPAGTALESIPPVQTPVLVLGEARSFPRDAAAAHSWRCGRMSSVLVTQAGAAGRGVACSFFRQIRDQEQQTLQVARWKLGDSALCCQPVTIFVGCGFAAKYLEGGGNFSVPLQWILGLRRLRQDAIWLELLPTSHNSERDEACIANFQLQLRAHGLAGRYALLYQSSPDKEHDLGSLRCYGLSRRELRERLAGPNLLLNLAYSIHPPFLLEFERRFFCDLDPSEIFYWMTRLDLGQEHHHEFWTIGLNVNADDCRMPKSPLHWRTFYPLVDTELMQPRPLPRLPKFTTIGQWYWGGSVEVNGEFPDLSKKHAFESYLDLPTRVPEATWELAMNLAPDDPEIGRLTRLGWQLTPPHKVTATPARYRRYLASASAEFTAIKGVDVSWQTGWVSDRAAAFLALGRPVITERTGAEKFLPPDSGMFFVNDAAEAAEAARQILREGNSLTREARQCAVEVFDAAKNLRKILDLHR